MEGALGRVREGGWQACEGADGEAKRNGSRVQEVTREGERVRRFLVHSPEREQHERKLREAQQEKVRQKLERLAERVAAGEFARKAERERKAREKRAAAAAASGEEPGKQEEARDAAARIGEVAGRILARDNGQRYYDWRLGEAGQLEYWENANCAAEKRREGHWLLETEEEGLSAVEAVRAYQDLWRVEAAFRSMKDVLELRPVWHRVEERVRAHVLVAALALGFDRVLQRKLEQAGLELLSSRAAWAALEAVSLVEFELPGGKYKAGVCVNGGDLAAFPGRLRHCCQQTKMPESVIIEGQGRFGKRSNHEQAVDGDSRTRRRRICGALSGGGCCQPRRQCGPSAQEPRRSADPFLRDRIPRGGGAALRDGSLCHPCRGGRWLGCGFSPVGMYVGY